MARSTRPDRQPVAVAPVQHVVAALLGMRVAALHACPVADLIVREAVITQDDRRTLKHRCLQRVVAGLELAALHAHRHGGVRLVCEAVATQVVGAQRQHRTQVRLPLRERLAGNAEDQVKVDAPDPGIAQDAHRAGHARRVMPAFERLQVAFMEALRTERDTVHARGHEHRGHLGSDGLRVRLHRPLRARRKRHARAHRVQRPSQHVRAQERGCAAAHEHRAERRVHEPRHGGELRIDPRGVRILPVLAIDEAVEVAVVALVEAERDVEVQPLEPRFHAGQRAIGGHGHGVGRTLSGDGERGGHGYARIVGPAAIRASGRR